MTGEGPGLQGRGRMTAKRVSEMTDGEIRERATPSRATTYWEAQAQYRSTIGMRRAFRGADHPRAAGPVQRNPAGLRHL